MPSNVQADVSLSGKVQPWCYGAEVEKFDAAAEGFAGTGRSRRIGISSSRRRPRWGEPMSLLKVGGLAVRALLG